jgi:hypothetical protein
VKLCTQEQSPTNNDKYIEVIIANDINIKIKKEETKKKKENNS